MSDTPRVIQKNLGGLMKSLVDRNYAAHPQILIGAVGDATGDRGSLQVGQFESGIEIDDNLGFLWLEGGGAGRESAHESYQNAIYFVARRTDIDSFEKRGKRGYLFLIGDEAPYDTVEPSEIRNLIGDGLEEPISIEAIIAEARQRYDIFLIRPLHTQHGRNNYVRQIWQRLLGADRVLELEDESAISETIALAVGLCEGKITRSEGYEDLAGIDPKKAASAIAAVSVLGSPTPPPAAPTTGTVRL
jgi:hypothetical protein